MVSFRSPSAPNPHGYTFFMRRISKLFLASFCLLLLTGCSSGNQLNALCDPAVLATENFSAEIERLWIIRSSEIDDDDAKLNEELKECFANPKEFLRNNETSWGYQSPSCDEYASFNKVPRISTSEMDSNFKKMYMVIVNNQACFSPEDVVEAQLKLGIK